MMYNKTKKIYLFNLNLSSVSNSYHPLSFRITNDSSLPKHLIISGNLQISSAPFQKRLALGNMG